MTDNKNQGKQIWHVACDESGIDGQKYYGFGSLWMKYQRRGEFSKLIRDLREKHGFYEEIKWKKAHSRRFTEFYHDLIDAFFKAPWLAFHCIVIEKAMVNKSFHNGDYDIARRKHFTKLITTKIENVMLAHPDRDNHFRIDLDPIASRYKKADEEFHQIANNVLKNKFGVPDIIGHVLTKDSKVSENIQIADFFLGAVMCAYQGKASSEVKIGITNRVASYLGWKTLQHDTWNTERKFNIWFFYDPKRGVREIETKSVVLKYPLPKKRSS